MENKILETKYIHSFSTHYLFIIIFFISCVLTEKRKIKFCNFRQFCRICDEDDRSNDTELIRTK